MSENLIAILALLSPVIFVGLAILSWFQPGLRPAKVIFQSKIASVISILIAGVSSYYVAQNGLIESGFIGFNEMGFSIRLDALSLIMLSMIALLAFVIIKFSSNYLDGDSKQGAFIGRLAATIASVQLLVLSGNLGLLFVSWVLTSISLHRLLLFYRERPDAQIAAKKKFILARLGDFSLLVAIGLLYNNFGTGDLETIFSNLKSGEISASANWKIELSAFFLAFTAILKSAQFPTYGWLIKVVETPTPVSALLHAGLLNAGPFLIIRMAFVMDASHFAPIVLMIVGGFTALFASVVYLTQTSVKTALGFSSIGHMGFSLMVCGLGVYPAAMLHLVAHSFYKAHAFLSSGSAIDAIRSSKIINPPQNATGAKAFLGIIFALSIYTFFAMLWGIDPERELSLLIIGSVIVLGLSKMFASALSQAWNLKLIAQAVLLSLTVATAFFSLESGMHLLLNSQVPEIGFMNLGKIIVAGLILLTFAAAIVIQMMAETLSSKPYFQVWAIHVRNGLYADAWFDKTVRALGVHSSDSKQIMEKPIIKNLHPNTKELSKQWV